MAVNDRWQHGNAIPSIRSSKRRLPQRHKDTKKNLKYHILNLGFLVSLYLRVFVPLWLISFLRQVPVQEHRAEIGPGAYRRMSLG
jgi:hypothetical protein